MSKRPSDRELEIKNEMLTCRHFNGVHRETCAAGVNYHAVVGEPQLGCMTRLPCVVIGEPQGGPRAECAKWETPTREEATASVDSREAAMKRHMSAFRKVHDDAKAKGYGRNHGGVAETTCPVCSGHLRYAVAAVNGHIHAKCETEGCVSWME